MGSCYGEVLSVVFVGITVVCILLQPGNWVDHLYVSFVNSSGTHKVIMEEINKSVFSMLELNFVPGTLLSFINTSSPVSEICSSSKHTKMCFPHK